MLPRRLLCRLPCVWPAASLVCAPPWRFCVANAVYAVITFQRSHFRSPFPIHIIGSARSCVLMAGMAALDRSRFRQVPRDTGSHLGGRNGCFVATQCTDDAHHRGDHQTVSDGGGNSSMLRSTRFFFAEISLALSFSRMFLSFCGCARQNFVSLCISCAQANEKGRRDRHTHALTMTMPTIVRPGLAHVLD